MQSWAERTRERTAEYLATRDSVRLATMKTISESGDEDAWVVAPLVPLLHGPFRCYTLDQAARGKGFASFKEFEILRRRMWLLKQMPIAMARGESHRANLATGQNQLF